VVNPGLCSKLPAMTLRIVEIHPTKDPKKLNSEWFVVENIGDKPFSTRNCVVSVSPPGSKKRRELSTMDPGFVIAPGEKVRVLTGNVGRKAHGKVPAGKKVRNYNLFLNASTLKGSGTRLVLALRSHVLTTALFDPAAKDGIGEETEPG